MKPDTRGSQTHMLHSRSVNYIAGPFLPPNQNWACSDRSSQPQVKLTSQFFLFFCNPPSLHVCPRVHKPDLISILGTFWFDYMSQIGEEGRRTEAGTMRKEPVCYERSSSWSPVVRWEARQIMFKSVSQSKLLQLNNPPCVGFLFLLLILVVFLLPCVVSFLFPHAQSLLCFLSSPQLRPREGKWLTGLDPDTKWKACQGGKWPLESEGALRPMKPFKGLC